MPLELPAELCITPPRLRCSVTPGGSFTLECSTHLPVARPVHHRITDSGQLHLRQWLFLYLIPHPMGGLQAHLVLNLSFTDMDLPTSMRLFRGSEGEDLINQSTVLATSVPTTAVWTGDGTSLKFIQSDVSRKSQEPFFTHVKDGWLKDALLPRRLPGAARLCSPTHLQLFGLLT